MYCLLLPYFKILLRSMTSVKFKHVFVLCALIFIIDYFGGFTHIFEKSYDKQFTYPYEGNIDEFITSLRNNKKPAIEPINNYNFTFLHDLKNKCEPSYQTFHLILMIKSAIKNFDQRMAIRNSWGFEQRFSDVPFKTIFLLGTSFNKEDDKQINAESFNYQDIVQANFIDSYYNNTIKTMMEFQWIYKYCLNSKYFMFIDDDMYVSIKNVLRFLRNPTLYPDYLKFVKKPIVHFGDPSQLKKVKRNIKKNYIDNNYSKINTRPTISLLKKKRQAFDFELPENVKLYAGHVLKSGPLRHKNSKWYVSLKEYPYDSWPPYVTAGAYILSKEAFLDMYYASLYTKHFRFDDIFLGLTAKKAGIEPYHCEEFYFYKKYYTKDNYKYVIASHGYDDPNELLKVWNEQKAMGNA